jgi:hypothetical protein
MRTRVQQVLRSRVFSADGIQHYAGEDSADLYVRRTLCEGTVMTGVSRGERMEVVDSRDERASRAATLSRIASTRLRAISMNKRVTRTSLGGDAGPRERGVCITKMTKDIDYDLDCFDTRHS